MKSSSFDNPQRRAFRRTLVANPVDVVVTARTGGRFGADADRAGGVALTAASDAARAVTKADGVGAGSLEVAGSAERHLRPVAPAISGELVDLGRGGARVRIGRWIDGGTGCLLRIIDPDGRAEPDEAAGVVRWGRHEAGRVLLGIEFDEPLDAFYAQSTGARVEQAPALRVLVVDDEVAIRELARRLLTKCGCEVETASDGETMLQALREFTPDMVLLDLRMPGLDGLGALRRLHEEALPAVPIWAMSAYVSDDEAREALRLGAIGFINKPFDFKHLQRVTRLSGVL